MNVQPQRDSFSPRQIDAEALCIYLHYMKLQPGTTNVVDSKSYFFLDFFESPVGAAVLPNQITALAANAFANGVSPPAYGSRIADLVWRRKGYLALVVDSDDQSIDQQNPLTIVGRQEPGGATNDGSHTFDGITYLQFPIHVSRTRTRTLGVVYAYNHLRDYSTGRDLEDGVDEFFELTLNFEQGVPLRAFAPDSGGTNMGPPVPPPALINLSRLVAAEV